MQKRKILITHLALLLHLQTVLKKERRRKLRLLNKKLMKPLRDRGSQMSMPMPRICASKKNRQLLLLSQRKRQNALKLKTLLWKQSNRD
jgi:hypothetical protein